VGASSSPLVVGRLRRAVSITGAMFLVAVAAAASIYPKPAETVAPRSYGTDILELVRSLTAPPGAPRENVADAETANNKPALVLASPAAIRALRTESILEMEDRLFGPQADPRLRLINSAPPYTLSDTGSYQTRLAYVSGSIEHSLFEAGQSAGLSDRLILKLAEIFGWDIDFALDVHAGDSFSAIYEEKYWLGRKVDDGLILAAEFINKGQVYRAIGFRNESGQLVYYTPDGRNLKRTFLRTPVAFSRVSSSYSGFRYHPVLKLWRAHTGVDYAAAVGTPVRATAAGTIAWFGWNGGYGRTVVVEHGDTYSTLYAHLSSYRTKLRVGAPIAQGEIIGYVGSSGLATGPHLHYEFRVNGQHRNPLAYESLDGDYVPPAKRAEFYYIAYEWIAQLNRMNQRFLASR
jgi:murein DD-endopeptidase MepM/ murein hydrolase activator NlpD